MSDDEIIRSETKYYMTYSDSVVSPDSHEGDEKALRCDRSVVGGAPPSKAIYPYVLRAEPRNSVCVRIVSAWLSLIVAASLSDQVANFSSLSAFEDVVLAGVDAYASAGACAGVDARVAASAAAASFAFFFARLFLCLAAALSLFFPSSSSSFPETEGGSGLRAFIGGEAIVGD